MDNKKIYWVIGIAAVLGFLYVKKHKKAKALAATQTKNPEVAKAAYNKMQDLFGMAPSGGNLPKNILDEVVKQEAIIEKAGFKVENNTLQSL